MTVQPIISREELLKRSHDWAKRLLDGPITYFPVRHHSPACAIRLSAWIESVRPRSVIIEGPCSFNRWIPCLLEDACRPPVAVLTTYRMSSELNTPRHSAFYPLCEYSPEWVALRQGSAVGARVQFADLEFADKVRAQTTDDSSEEERKSLLGVLLADESQWRHSQFIAQIVRRLGCRDFDELWDHLFESRTDMEDTHDFVGRLATYCDLSRMDHEGRLEHDGTLAREAVMEEVIRSELSRLKNPTQRGSILVVTGGFHTVALVERLSAAGRKPKPKSTAATPRTAKGNAKGAAKEEQAESWLIRYSYDQLDSLGGYQSGMPSPGFYDAMWRAATPAVANGEKIDAQPRRQAAARMISQVARSTRGGSLGHEASVTDSIAAVAMMDQLANLRGHAVPTRNDMLDAITSCMRKDALLAADGLNAIVLKLLAGDAIGSVPASAGQPPIVQDFRYQCEQLRLPASVIDGKQVTLELYRKPAHRAVSAFLHQLLFLGIPYAQILDGPDFTHGYHLGKLSEEWQVAWSPTTEARLIEMASYGESVSAAALQRLEERILQLDSGDSARDASVVVDELVNTCRMGLHSQGERLIQLILKHIAEDSVFASMSLALSKLMLLLSAREPLEASRLESLPALVQICYQRACHLAEELGTLPDDLLDASLDGLCSLRELLAQDEHTQLDSELLVVALQRCLAVADPHPRSEIAGAAAGILHSLSRMDEDGVCRVIESYLDASVTDVGAACGAVRGLMMTARESFWRMRGLLKKIDELFNQWEEDRFRVALPQLRLAFSQLSPKETDLVAERVAALHEVEDLGSLHHPSVSEADLHFGLAVDRLVKQAMQEDGL